VFFKEQNNKIDYLLQSKIEISSEVVYVINVGSVGQPRDGDPRASFCIYDNNRRIVEIKRVDYNIKEAQDKIIKSGLPEVLAWRLAEGR
jgi:diadenosine tetraphosphatase ApaH/serine/threonine PP2A family protein phosphatase